MHPYFVVAMMYKNPLLSSPPPTPFCGLWGRIPGRFKNLMSVQRDFLWNGVAGTFRTNYELTSGFEGVRNPTPASALFAESGGGHSAAIFGGSANEKV